MGDAAPHQAIERWLFELQVWVLSQGISAWLADLRPYEPCRVAGVVERVLLDPRSGVIAVSISDGTGGVIAEWGIRRPTPELAATPGRAVVLNGIASVGAGGGLVLREPIFETHSFPEVA